jgi:TIR domain
MANVSKIYDVFISHSASDATLAMEVANACRADGLEAITHVELQPRADVSDASWEALAESQALLAILSPSGPTPSMAIEIGAARAWNKAIFAVLTDPSSTRLPPALAGTRLYPTARIEDVIKAIKTSVLPLSDADRALLAEVYAAVGVTVDQLALDPGHLAKLVGQFNRSAKKNVSGERLLWELLRMRKQKKLTPSRSLARSKPRHGAD